MHRRSTTLPAVLITGLAAWACVPDEGPAGEAELVLLNGHVITVDADDTEAEAIAIRGGVIAAVGSTVEIEALAGPSTERIDLGGRTATPGLLAAHAHFADTGWDRLFVLDLAYPNVQSVADVVGEVAGMTERLEPGSWVQGAGWDEGKLEELRYLHSSDLDPVSAEHPVWLMHTMGHYGVANTLALELAGISRDTPDPPGGTIDRKPDGTPTGVLKESAMRLVRQLIPPGDAAQGRSTPSA